MQDSEQTTNNVEDSVKQEESTVEKSTAIIQEETYPMKDLIDNCQALGYKKEVVMGALYNFDKTEISKTEFKKVIENFLGKKVK